MQIISQDEYKKYLLIVLKKIDEICSELDINYWIMYGSLIGAVRHKGFIPWDDDVDIALKRNDYEKLIKHLMDNPDKYDPFYLDSYKNNNKYPFYISRFCDRRVLLKFKEKNYSSGAFVDLYPFDGMGNDNESDSYKQLFDEMTALRKKNAMACSPSLLYGSSIAHKIGNLPELIICKTMGRDFYLDKLDEMSRKYTWDESRYVGLTGWASYTVYFEKEWFNSSIRLPFESIEVNAPAEYDKILTAVYGDYMKLPPEENRVATHGYTVYQID